MSFTFGKAEKVNKVLQLKAFMTIISHTAQCKVEQMSFGLFALNSLCILWIGITTLYYTLDYYKEYFKSDDEIHAIVNFNYKTTTKISVMGNLLDVSVYEYVDKEEHDAKLLFSGMLLKEYHVNKDTGEIEEIQ